MSGITSALDVPVGVRGMKEKGAMWQRVMSQVTAVIHPNVGAFCSRGCHCAGVNGTSRNEPRSR